MSLSMNRQEREAFLAQTHVAVISVADDGRGPLTIPIWYHYEPGGVLRFVTGDGSRKAGLMRKAGRIGLCVQSESPPYQYVSIEGPVALSAEIDYERDVRQVALRYLGKEMGEMYLAVTAAERDTQPSVLVTLKPERWRTVDYNKMG